MQTVLLTQQSFRQQKSDILFSPGKDSATKIYKLRKMKLFSRFDRDLNNPCISALHRQELSIQ
jgi:hypothetical protein